MEEIWKLAGILFGGGGLGALLVHEWLLHRRRRREQRMGDAFRAMHEVYALLETLEFETGAARAEILITENGGGIPSPESPLYSTVLYETRQPGIPGVRGEWVRQLADRHYVSLLGEIFHSGRALIETEALPSECLLRDLYERHGIVFSEAHRLGATKKAFIYLSLSYQKPVDRDGPHRDAVRAGVNALQNLIREHAQLV